MRSSYLLVSALIPGISLIKSQATHVHRAVGTGGMGAIDPLPPIMTDQLTLFQLGQGGAAPSPPPGFSDLPSSPYYAVNNEYIVTYLVFY